MNKDKSTPVSWWAGWRRLALPALFLLGVIYYEELFLKVYCFHTLTVEGVVFTFLFTLPMALLLGLLCGGASTRAGRLLPSRALPRSPHRRHRTIPTKRAEHT